MALQVRRAHRARLLSAATVVFAATVAAPAPAAKHPVPQVKPDTLQLTAASGHGRLRELYVEFGVARTHATRVRVSINGARAPILSYINGTITADPQAHHRAGHYVLHRRYGIRIVLCTSADRCSNTVRQLEVRRRIPHGEGSKH